MNCPKLLKCTHYKIEHLSFTRKRTVTDYEIDFYLEGEINIFIDNQKIPIEPNTIVFKKPGQIASGIGKFNCYMLTLDFSNTKDNTLYTRNSSTNLQNSSNNELITNIPSYFTPSHSAEIKNLFQLLSIYSDQAKNGELNSIIMELLHLIAADSYQHTPKNHITSDDLTYICRYMQKHYNENITIEDLAEKIHLNKSYFIRKFNSIFNKHKTKSIKTTP